MTKIVELIYTTEKIWKWTEDDIVRRKYQLFTKDWELICEHDSEIDKNYWMEKLKNL